MRLTTALRSSVLARAAILACAARLAFGLLLPAVFAATIAVGATAARAQDQELKVGSTAPELTTDGFLTGSSKIGAMNEPDKTYLVVFATTKQRNGRALLENLSTLHKALRANGFTVIVIYDESRDAVSQHIGSTASLSIDIAIDREKKSNTDWMQAAKQDSFPFAFLVRARKILWMGSPGGGDFSSVAREASIGRYNPQLAKSAKDKLRAGDEAVRLKNFKDAWKHYDDVIKTDPIFFGDVAVRKYKALLIDAKDPAAARAWGEEMLKQYANDGITLAEFARAIADDDDIKDRDFELALRVADATMRLGGSHGPHLALRAEINYRAGNLETAVELQREAWMSVEEDFKPAYKADYDRYKKLASKAKSGASKAGSSKSETPN
jgi:tetratricopeptide (TPR) repeat protein